jgi:two-component system, LytTR family, response regulator
VIRTLIADDEPLAREGLRIRLDSEPDIEIVGEATDGPSTVTATRRLLPDLLLLDIQMPGMTGLEAVELLARDHLPRIVFVTAHDRYAIKAFDVHAVDYLLKPVSNARLHEALERVRNDLDGGGRSAERVAALLQSGKETGGRSPGPQYWAVKDGERFLLLRAEEVDWIEAAANYIRFHARGRDFLMRGTLGTLANGLDPARFARIHRSAIVNLDRVQEIRREWHGDYNVILTTGQTLRLGRQYRAGLLGR